MEKKKKENKEKERRSGGKYVGKKTKNRILERKSVSLCLWEWC